MEIRTDIFSSDSCDLVVNGERSLYQIVIPKGEPHMLGLRCIGLWKMDTATEMIDDCLQVVERHLADNEWGAFVDMSLWELCTPEVVEYFTRRIYSFVDLNLRWQAIRYNNHFHKMVANECSQPVEDRLTTNYFYDSEEALIWLRGRLVQCK